MKVKIILIAFFILIFISSCGKSISKNNEKNKHYEVINFGLSDINGNNIDNGTPLSIKEGVINLNVKLSHDIAQEREYLLLFLQDFRQSYFILNENNEEVNKYRFSIPANSKNSTSISCYVKPGTKELAILVIQMPDYKLKDLDFVKANVLQNALVFRHPILEHVTDVNNFTFPYVVPDYISEEGPIDDIFLSFEEIKLKAVMSSEESKKLYLSVGNASDTEEWLTYAVIAFKDWEQVEVLPERDVMYTKVGSNRKNIYEITLPEIESEVNFQIIAFPYPFKVKRETYDTQNVCSSFRLVIEPRK